VGAVVVETGRVLLVRRGRAPGAGRWSLPGGVVELGEPLEAAVQREVAEECGLAIRVHGLVGVVDRIVRDAAGRVRYHYILLDYLASPAGGHPRPGSDALAVRWCDPGELGGLELTEGVETMLHRALAMNAERLEGEGRR
jgi:ADP-ribose pyrophosphatase YjhB (NUDIX family)